MDKFIQKLNYAVFLIVGVFIGLAIQLGERKLSEPKPAIYSLDLVVVDGETEEKIEYPTMTQPNISGYSACEMEAGEIRMIWEADKQHEPVVKIEAAGYEQRIVPISMIQIIDSNFTQAGIFGPYTLKLNRSIEQTGDDNSPI